MRFLGNSHYFHCIIPHIHILGHLTFHRGTTNPTRSVGLQDTPLYGRTRLYDFMALINEIDRKLPLFSPAQAPHHRLHTHSRNASPFTEAQRTQPGPWTTGPPPQWINTRTAFLTFPTHLLLDKFLTGNDPVLRPP